MLSSFSGFDIPLPPVDGKCCVSDHSDIRQFEKKQKEENKTEQIKFKKIW